MSMYKIADRTGRIHNIEADGFVLVGEVYSLEKQDENDKTEIVASFQTPHYVIKRAEDTQQSETKA